MAKTATLTLEPQNEDKELDEIVDKLEKLNKNSLTMEVHEKEPEYVGPTVSVFLPELAEDPSVKIDQYEHVTIANEDGIKHYKVHRGEHVDVPVPVFLALRERYKKL